MQVSPFQILSADDGASLSFEWHGGGYVTAVLRGSAAEARTRVWFGHGEYEGLGIADFLAELAASWRGWEGEKPWAPCDAEIDVTATSDRSGHISLSIEMHLAHAPRWDIRGTLIIEAGQLAGLADRARAFEYALKAAA